MMRRVLKLIVRSCAGLSLAGCVAPQPHYIRLQPVAHSPARQPRLRVAACEGPARPRLTEAQKASLFDDFDTWKDGHRAPGEPPDTAMPAPGRAAATRAAGRACRVTGS